MDSNNMNNGYHLELVETLPIKYLCPLCKRLMRDPIQTFRGELACEHCYKEALRNNNGCCPIDHEPISENHLFKDKSKTLEINDLQCFCNNKRFGCSWIGKVVDIENHQDECQFKSRLCEYCEANLAPNMLFGHLKTCPGIFEQNACIYKDIGCDYKTLNVEDVVDHLKDATIAHSALYIISLKNMEIKFQTLLEHEKENSKIKEIKQQNDYQSLLNQISIVTKTVESLKSKLDEKRNYANYAAEADIDSNAISRELDINRKDIERIDSTYSVLSTNLSELDLKQQLLENSSYNGKLLWKIDNYSYRLNQAIIGKVTALHSAPCFTSQYGYKFCARLYLNGDGMGRNTHMSLFFVCMKAEYDNLLPWPFNRRVCFRLINQADESKTLKESFVPDSNSSSFQKPTKQMNVAAGCPMFISKDYLNNAGFIKEDCLFIEISASL